MRTSAFFGTWDTSNFAVQALTAIRQGRPWRAAADIVISPTYVPDLVNAALDLLLDGESGIWHLSNDGALVVVRVRAGRGRGLWRRFPAGRAGRGGRARMVGTTSQLQRAGERARLRDALDGRRAECVCGERDARGHRGMSGHGGEAISHA